MKWDRYPLAPIPGRGSPDDLAPPDWGRVREVFLRGRHVVRDGALADDLTPGEFVACGPPDSDIT